jgi:homoserine dehydrogenase
MRKNLRIVKWPLLCLPQFVQMDDPLSFVKNEYNGVSLKVVSGRQAVFFMVKALVAFQPLQQWLSDISALRTTITTSTKNYITINLMNSLQIST